MRQQTQLNDKAKGGWETSTMGRAKLPRSKGKEKFTLSSQRRDEVCSQGQVQKRALRGNNIYIYIYIYNEQTHTCIHTQKETYTYLFVCTYMYSHTQE